ncbi:hypothetical protein GUJ93_ZPchr0013g36645 [Zizania palustris]|uniref:C2H2-type domain-containing protein n=1 Tax=Zizania palustris TaxID=103762 RepID=A0A8J5X167_ZIZPA|nr:hypothetical protein GUJ93_ZPchr0013g36645 [Zizania palustris]
MDGGDGARRPLYYECTHCKRGFTNAQALGGHMNVHRKERATAGGKASQGRRGAGAGSGGAINLLQQYGGGEAAAAAAGGAAAGATTPPLQQHGGDVNLRLTLGRNNFVDDDCVDGVDLELRLGCGGHYYPY